MYFDILLRVRVDFWIEIWIITSQTIGDHFRDGLLFIYLFIEGLYVNRTWGVYESAMLGKNVSSLHRQL